MDNKQFLMYNIVMIAISLGISITLSLFLPFYISLPLIIVKIICHQFLHAKRTDEEDGWLGAGMFGSLSSPFSGNSINYYCMSCGTKHKEGACPRCGSNMKRVG